MAETNPRMSQFLVRSNGKRYMKDMALRILSAMREGICEQFELHGYGKFNI